MKITDLDTKGYLYDPRKPESYQQLFKYEEFREEVKSIDKIMQYIILMYDLANREIVVEYPLYPNRKREVARIVGLSRAEKMPKWVEDVLIGKNPKVNRMIVKYISLFNDPDLEMLAAYQEIYTNLNEAAFGGKYDKQLIDNIKKVNEDIKQLNDRIFRGKDETDLRMELYKAARDKALGIRPEEIAEKLAAGEDPLDGYGAYGDYKPDDMKFMGDK